MYIDMHVHAFQVHCDVHEYNLRKLQADLMASSLSLSLPPFHSYILTLLYVYEDLYSCAKYTHTYTHIIS